MKVKMITKNECLIYAEGKVYLQSYDTIVACKSIGENPILYKDWDFSRTTMRQVNNFLSDVFKKHITKKEIIKMAKEGKVFITDKSCNL